MGEAARRLPPAALPPHVRRGARSTPAPQDPAQAPWSRDMLAGRLVELSDPGAGAPLTMAVSLVHDAQRRRETVAWVTSRSSAFFPPDVAASGVDLDALAVIRLPDPSCVARAADRLLRSGAFGLVVLDLGRGDVTMPLQARLLGLAERHDAAVLCLTEKPHGAPSLSSLVSLRVETARRRASRENGSDTTTDAFACSVTAVKDKRRPPGWTQEVVRCRGS